MIESLLGTSNLASDHFSRLLALGIAFFSPVSILVWAAAEKLLSANEGLAGLEGRSDDRRD